MSGRDKIEHDPKGQKDLRSEKQNREMPTVKFDPDKITRTVKADLWQNIKLLKEVAPNDFDMIYAAALCSISTGRALHILYRALITIDGMNKQQAEDISRSLNTKPNSL